MNILKKALKKLDGWKTVLAYLLAQIPWFSANPLVLEAINKVLANPENTEAWVNLAVQILLLVGVADIVRKNVTQGVARAGASK